MKSGDEAISLNILRIVLILPLIKGDNNGYISF